MYGPGETARATEPTPPADATSPGVERQRALHRGLKRLLRPLVRFLIAEQVTFPMLDELIRSLYVEVADSDYRIPGKAQSASRVALLTGIHRREVKRLREAAVHADPEPAAFSLSARLIADWNAQARFLDDEGQPVPLNRSSRRPGPSLRDLAEMAGQDIRPQAILDEWVRLGVVELDADGRVHLRSGSFVAESGFDEKIDFFGRTVGSHIDAASRNVRREGPPSFDQVVYYGSLRPESAAALSALARDLGMHALREWNREAARRQEADAGAADATERLHFGAYVALDSERASDD